MALSGAPVQNGFKKYYSLAFPFSSWSESQEWTTEKILKLQFYCIPMISTEIKAGFIIYYLLVSSSYCRSADKLKKMIQLYLLYSDKDLSALCHPAPAFPINEASAVNPQGKYFHIHSPFFYFLSMKSSQIGHVCTNLRFKSNKDQLLCQKCEWGKNLQSQCDKDKHEGVR